jgi:hypothetical protein
MLAAVTAPAARAGFTVTIGSAQIGAGQTGTVDVMISGGPELLDFYVAEFQFRITPVGSGATGGLRFTDPQAVSYVNDPAYVFAGNSLALSRSVTTTLTAADTLTIGDSTADFAGVDVSGGRLLARLEFAAAAAAAGSTYRVELVGSASQFQDPSFNGVPFQAVSGVVSVSGTPDVSAVPAPRGLALAATGLPVLAGWVFACRRARSGTAPT